MARSRAGSDNAADGLFHTGYHQCVTGKCRNPLGHASGYRRLGETDVDVLKQKSVCYKGDFDCEGERACSEQKEIFVFNQASSGEEPCGLILLCWLILS